MELLQLRLPLRGEDQPGRPHVLVDGRALPVEYARHRRARHYILRVRDDGGLRVTIPRGGSQAEAERFVHTRHAWILRELHRLTIDATRTGPWQADPDVERRLRRLAATELPARLAQLAQAHGFQVTA
ncbi:MAG: DUF45 domain-containing protein, partial [Acidobacteria bacterium]|nr:DUF45 domain-containing protein [Acidobacteriota bacterium]